MPMKPLLAGIVVAAPQLAVTLLFALNQQAEVTIRQDQIRAHTEVRQLKFDRDFARAWNGQDLPEPSDTELAALEKKAAAIDAKRADFDEHNARNRQDLQDAVDSAGTEPQDPATQARVTQLLRAEQRAGSQ